MNQKQIQAINEVKEDDYQTMLDYLRSQNSSLFSVKELEFLLSCKFYYEHENDYIKQLFDRILKQEIKRAQLWMILVPNEWADREKIPIKVHKEWDEAVEKIANGLTIFHPTKGRWICPNNVLFEEEMIPVAIYCTECQINEIAEMTAKHYNQISVMFYEISNKVFIKQYGV